MGSSRNKNNWSNARKCLFGSYSHSGIPGFPFRLFYSQEQNSRNIFRNIFRNKFLFQNIPNERVLRFWCSSGHVFFKMKSVTLHYFYISGITNSSSFRGKIFRKKSVLENFRANVLKWFNRQTLAFTKMHAIYTA